MYFKQSLPIYFRIVSPLVVQRSAGPSTRASAQPVRRSTMWRTTWWSAGLRWRRSVRTRQAATPPTPSAPSGQSE